MAYIFPEGWRELEPTGSAAREMETLKVLAAGLDERFMVFHGVHWTRINEGHQVFGEIDFVVIGPTGRILLIEQKSGFLGETDTGLSKLYADKEKNVPAQMARMVNALDTRLRQALKGQKTPIESLLYCPDYKVKQPGSAGLDPSRIVDASKREHLVQVIESILVVEEAPQATMPQLKAFFADLLKLVPEVHAIRGAEQTLYTRLSGGLAQWAQKLAFEPFRLRVVATAGSGKTQLALAVFREAVAAGRRPLYVCYNRPLADHVALIAPPGGEVATYHQLCDRIVRSQGSRPDFLAKDVFAQLERGFDALQPGADWMFDELIVDEGQDFQQRWADNLLRLLKPAGRAWWLEDPMQNLYGRDSVSLPGWVTLHSDINYRSPGDILLALNRLVPLERPVQRGSPLSGSEVEILTYADTAGLVRQTTAAITHAIGAGFKRDMIAVVTCRGRERSSLAPYDKLGPYTLKAPSGQYDLLGNPLFSDGEVIIDSVYRFKGQAAPCIVFTEIDFEALDDLTCRRLFVGATRATAKLLLVMSERSAKILLERGEKVE